MITETASGSISTSPVFAAAVFLVMMIIALMAIRDRRYVLFSYMLLLPLIALPITSGRLAGIPGLSIQNIVMGLGVYILYLSGSRQTRMDNNLRLAFIVYWLVVTLTVFHGMFYLSDLNKTPGFETLGIYTYLRGYLILPLLSWISFVVAYRYAATGAGRSIEYLRYFGIAMIVFASVVLGSVLYYFAQGLNYTAVRAAVAVFIGIHSNDWAFGFVMAVPFLIAGGLSKAVVPKSGRMLLWLALVGSVTAILFSYSRSAYVALFLVSFGFALLRKRTLLLLFIPLLVGLVFFGPASVLERTGFGFTQGSSKSSQLDVNTISSGRLELGSRAFEIIASNLAQTAFGNGRWTFPRAAINEYPGITHPHNAYLELILDAGLLGFIPLFSVYLLMFSRFIVGARTLRSSQYNLIYTAAVLALGCRLIMAISGGSFYPLPHLLFMWQVLGFALGLLRRDTLQLRQPQRIKGQL
jgi:hypothetical protein